MKTKNTRNKHGFMITFANYRGIKPQVRKYEKPKSENELRWLAVNYLVNNNLPRKSNDFKIEYID